MFLSAHAACSLRKRCRAPSTARAAWLQPMKILALIPYWQVHACIVYSLLRHTCADSALQRHPQTRDSQRSLQRRQRTIYRTTLTAPLTASPTFHPHPCIHHCHLRLPDPLPPHLHPQRNQLPPMQKSRRASAPSPTFSGATLQQIRCRNWSIINPLKQKQPLHPAR